ncbi:MAG: LysE family translocator [Vibrio sp.]
MTLTEWGSLFLVCLLGAMSPGPSLAMVMKHSLSAGCKNGLATAWAHACGIGLYAVITIAGLAVLLHNSPVVFNVITYAGAAYLAYLGVNALRSRGGIAERMATGHVVSLWQSAQEGLLISLLNPKIGLFFIALFSQFVAVGHDAMTQGIIVLTPVVVDGLWYTLITLLLSYAGILNLLRNNALLIDRLSGVVLILLALRVLWG